MTDTPGPPHPASPQDPWPQNAAEPAPVPPDAGPGEVPPATVPWDPQPATAAASPGAPASGLPATGLPATRPASALERQRLDRRVIAYWWLSGTVSTVVLATILGGLLLAGRTELTARGLWHVAYWAASVLLGLKLLWTLVAPPWSWRRWRWGMDHELLVLRWGIISHHERAIPISRLQHVDLTRGPIERLFGLTTLVVHTAGPSAASFDLPGLADADARALRDRVLAARGDDVI